MLKNGSKRCDGDFYNIFTLIWTFKKEKKPFFQSLNILFTHQRIINYFE